MSKDPKGRRAQQLILSRRLLCLVLSTALSGISMPARAWKVDVHVWVAAEVLKDAADGNILISAGDAGDKEFSLDLPRSYAAAIRAHPRLYLLGSLGPDAFPDVMGGQLVIHPSYPGGWGTADWLRRLLSKRNISSEELAFTLGYLSHAAADTFAHTFVNRYAGDLFQAFDHPTAATRHIYIEGLVSKYMPPISFRRLGGSGDAASLLRRGGRIEFPEELIRDSMLLDGEAAKQFERGGAVHLSLAYGLYRDLGNFVEEGGPLEQLQVKIKKFVAELYLGVPIDERIVEELNRLENEITDKLNDAAADLKPILDRLNSELAEIEGMPDKLAEESLKVAVDAAVELAKLQAQLNSWQNRAHQLQNQIDDLVRRGAHEVRKWACSDRKEAIFGLGACIGWGWVITATGHFTELRNRLEAANNMVSQYVAGVATQREKLKNAISSGMTVLRHRHELNRLARGAVIAMATDKPFGDGMRNRFLRWYESIPVALVEFTRANAATIVNTVDPAIVGSFDPERPGLMDPLRNWIICYGPTFLSVPAALGDQVCAGIEGVGTIKDDINEFEKRVGEVLPPLGDALRLKKEILTEIEKIKAKVLDQTILEGLKAFDSVTDAKAASFYEALATDITPAKVNEAMSHDKSGQQLLRIPDTAQRIMKELALNAKGHVDPNRFPAIYNSIILSKLALLDAGGLQRLARLAGVNYSSVYKNGLYGDGSPQTQNILFGFLRSIDGNHQWQELAPPHPRATHTGYDEADFKQRRSDPENFGYGYRDEGCTRIRGMRFWVDPTARDLVFKQIFRGKITLGIDEPDALGSEFPRVLPDRYPDLYDEADGWYVDAIGWPGREQGQVVLRLTGTGRADRSVELLVPGQERIQVKIDATGRLDVSQKVPQHTLPARIELVEIGGADALRYSFNIGCDGKGVQMGVDQAPAIVVEQGDNLWRISQRITGDGRRYPEIVAANSAEIADPNLIYPHQMFQSPWPVPFSMSVNAAVEAAAQ